MVKGRTRDRDPLEDIEKELQEKDRERAEALDEIMKEDAPTEEEQEEQQRAELISKIKRIIMARRGGQQVAAPQEQTKSYVKPVETGERIVVREVPKQQEPVAPTNFTGYTEKKDEKKSNPYSSEGDARKSEGYATPAKDTDPHKQMESSTYARDEKKAKENYQG